MEKTHHQPQTVRHVTAWPTINGRLISTTTVIVPGFSAGVLSSPPIDIQQLNNMSIPSLPLVPDYITLSSYVRDVLTTDKVDAKGAITAGLSLLAQGWAEHLAKSPLCDDQIIVSRFTCADFSLT